MKRTVMLASTALAFALSAANKNAPAPAADAGNTAPAAEPAKGKKPRNIGIIGEISSDWKIPEGAKSQRGASNRSPYPFDKLEVGQSFPIDGKTRDEMSSIVSNQNRSKANNPTKKDANGQPVAVMQEVRDPAGNVIGSVPKPGEFETIRIKEFECYETGPNSCRVIRVK